jgi:outer membrane protein OmpA-like peptidoglycan-associated protein
MSQLIDHELEAALQDERAALENVFAEAMQAQDTGEFFARAERGVRALARDDTLPGTRLDDLLRAFAARLRRYQDEGFGELEALADMANRFASEGLAEAAPLLGGLAARALAGPLARRAGAPFPRPLRQQLVRSAQQSAQTLVRRRGPQALRALLPVVRRTQRAAMAQGLPGQALPAAMRRTTTIAMRNPALVQQLSHSRITNPVQLWILDRFEFAKVSLQEWHKNDIRAMANLIRTSQATLNPIRWIDLLGHTDPVGSDADNYHLGCLRAWSVTKELKKALGWPLNQKLRFRVVSLGERQPIPGDDAASRRVEVSLYLTAPSTLPVSSVRCDLPGKKIPSKTPDEQPPTSKPPTTQCDWEVNINWDEKFARHYDSCCGNLQASRAFCSWARDIPEICRLTPQQFESRVDDCVHGNVYAEVVAETGIIGGSGNNPCNPAAVVAKRYAGWKRGKNCWTG